MFVLQFLNCLTVNMLRKKKKKQNRLFGLSASGPVFIPCILLVSDLSGGVGRAVSSVAGNVRPYGQHEVVAADTSVQRRCPRPHVERRDSMKHKAFLGLSYPWPKALKCQKGKRFRWPCHGDCLPE